MRYLDEVIDDGPDCLVIACNLMAFMFLCDESTDKMDRSGARAYAEIVMDALRNPHPHRPQGEPKVGEVARQYALSYPRAVGCPIDDNNDPFAGSHCKPSKSRARRLGIASSTHMPST
jgi:hypothetical protein